MKQILDKIDFFSQVIVKMNNKKISNIINKNLKFVGSRIRRTQPGMRNKLKTSTVFGTYNVFLVCGSQNFTVYAQCMKKSQKKTIHNLTNEY